MSSSLLCAQGIGLPMEEAMKFWRAEFGPKISGEKFDKEYAYNVRYNYAKEGKRTDYTPYSCKKIISIPVPKVCP
jgi:DNA primase large subunit